MIANFKKIELGEVVLDISPDMSKKNPRNSEGAFLQLDNSDIIFMYSHFYGDSSADHASADLALMRSSDGGFSWVNEGIKIRCKEDDEAANIMSLSLLAMNDGSIGLFYLIRKTYRLMRIFLRRSYNGGETWGDPILCSSPSDYYVVNNDRVIRLSSGRIIIPLADHRITGFDDGSYSWDSRSDTVFCISDDDGLTWRMSPHRVVIPYMRINAAGLQEPGVIELENGVLWGWARTELGRQYEFFSHNGGWTWTIPSPSEFTSPCSPLSMKHIVSENMILGVYNPIPAYNGRNDVDTRFTGGRTPLAVSVSRNGGSTFSAPLAIEDDPSKGYCYCAIYETDEAVLLAYCAGGPEDGSILSKTRIRRISKDELASIE